MVVKTVSKAEQMAEDLTGQEIRGMAKYATDEPSENWSPEFWKKFKRWSDDLAAYERQEHAELAAPRARGGTPQRGDGGLG